MKGQPNRLKGQIRKYSGSNLDDPLGQNMLKLHRMTNTWPDISKKLQKLDNCKYVSLEKLREARRYM